MSVHRIRLRGPWRYEWLSAAPETGGPGTGRVSLPQAWQSLFGERVGRVCFTRTFHRPTNLEPGCQVDLVFEGLGGRAEISLNGQKFDGIGVFYRSGVPLQIDVTDRLQLHNELEVVIEFDPAESSAPGGLWGLVVLEIHEPPGTPERV